MIPRFVRMVLACSVTLAFPAFPAFPDLENEPNGSSNNPVKTDIKIFKPVDSAEPLAGIPRSDIDEARSTFIGTIIIDRSMIGVERILTPASDFLEDGKNEKYSEVINPTLTIRIDGVDARFRFDDRRFEPDSDIVHYTGELVGDFAEDGNYISFSYDTTSKALVSTLQIGEVTYRTVSRKEKGSIVDDIYRLLPDYSSPISPAGQRIGNASKSIRGMTKLEEEHVENNELVRLRPTFFDEYSEGYNRFIMLRGADLGTVDLFVEQAQIPDRISAYLRSIAPVTRASGVEDFEVDTITGSQEVGYTVYFRQIINGIPIDKRNSVEIEAFTGRILSLNFFLTQHTPDPTEPKVVDGDTRVMEIALDAITERFGAAQLDDEGKSQLKAKETYIVNDDSSLSRVYRVRVEQYIVTIDAETGETTVVDDVAHVGDTQLFRDTCKQNSSTLSKACPESNAPLVLKETSSGKQCVDGSSCDARHDKVYDVIAHTWFEWAVADASSCCAGAGIDDNRIGAIIDSNEANRLDSAAWHPWKGVILIPSLGGASAHKAHRQVALDAEVVSHEFGHSAQRELAEELSLNLGWFATSLEEGYSDAIASQTSQRQSYGTPWKFGEYSLNIWRDMTVLRTFDQLSVQHGRYDNVLVFDNMFYRLSGEPGVSLNSMGILIFKSLKSLFSAGGSYPNAFDLDDLKRALLAAAAGNSTLTAAVNAVWNDMDDSDLGNTNNWWLNSRNTQCGDGGIQSKEFYVSALPGATEYKLTGSVIKFQETVAEWNAALSMPLSGVRAHSLPEPALNMRGWGCALGPNPFYPSKPALYCKGTKNSEVLLSVCT